MSKVFVKKRMIDDCIRQATNIYGGPSLRQGDSLTACAISNLREALFTHESMRESGPSFSESSGAGSPRNSVAFNLLILYKSAGHVEPSGGAGNCECVNGERVLLSVRAQGKTPPRERFGTFHIQRRGNYPQVSYRYRIALLMRHAGICVGMTLISQNHCFNYFK